MTKRVAVLALLLGLVLVGGASAGGSAQSSTWATLAHGGSAARYLTSLGLDPSSFVVQRGRRNYAGPKCPGKGWTCTNAPRVLQVAMSGGFNSVSCSASGGGGSVVSSGGTSSSTCKIVQVSSTGSNTATCTESSSTTSSGTLTQSCDITQTSTSGSNKATVTQTLVQGPSACSPPSGTSSLQTQTATQIASIVQSSPAGGATANVSQTASQCASSTTTGAVSESQSTDQEFTIRQGPIGFDPSSPNCNNHGVLGATATQSQHQDGYAGTATSGTQNQHADLIGHIDQCSLDHADYSAAQSEDQFFAPNPNAGVVQTQTGPTHFQGKPAPPRGARVLQRGDCCSFQGTNPTDFCTITQTTSQIANPNAVQTEQLTTTAGTSGSCTGKINGTQNGADFSATSQGSNVNNAVTCQSQVCTGTSQVPTKLVWSGDTSGTFHDNATLAATLTRTDTNAPVSGETVALGIDGGESCSALTDASGVASCSVNLGDTPGDHTASASYAGSSTFLGSSTGPVAFTVLKAPTTSTLTFTGDLSQYYHDSVSLSAQLVEAHHPATGIVGKTVTFTISQGSDQQSCSGTTDSNGDAACSFVLTLTPGTGYTVEASFAGDAFYTPSSDSHPFEVLKAPTTLSYTGELAEDYHDTATLSGHLAEAHNPGTAISGRSVTFTISGSPGSQTCTAVTGSTGDASCSVVLTLKPGTGYTVTASFDGSSDVFYTSSSDSKPFQVTREESAVVYTGATTGDYSDSVTLKGVLTEDAPGGPPLAGRRLTLTLGTGPGAQSCVTGATDASGAASCKLTINLPAGSYPVTASFAGDDYYLAGTGSASFKVTPEEDSLSYTGATSGKKGTTVTLSAKLVSDGGGIPNRTIVFTVGSQSCSGTTNSYGNASCSLTLTQSAGSSTVKATFAGDAFYEAASVTKPFTIKS